MEPTTTPDTSAPPDPALASPEAARTKIDRIRADTAHAWHQPGHRQHGEAQKEMEALYQRALGRGAAGDGPPAVPGLVAPPVPAAEAATPDAAPAEPAPESNTSVAPELPPGMTWDEPTLHALGEVATREAIDPGLMREGTALVARLLGERAPVLTGEEAEDVLAQRWGSKYEHQIARATETWELLPKRVQDDLTKSGIRYHPEFAEFLLKVGEHRWDPMTEAGLARIKARGLAALEAEAKKGASRP